MLLRPLSQPRTHAENATFGELANLIAIISRRLMVRNVKNEFSDRNGASLIQEATKISRVAPSVTGTCAFLPENALVLRSKRTLSR
jgi:hypothetical protein